MIKNHRDGRSCFTDISFLRRCCGYLLSGLASHGWWIKMDKCLLLHHMVTYAPNNYSTSIFSEVWTTYIIKVDT